MQSSLQCNTIATFPKITTSLGPLTQMRQGRFILVYLSFYALAALLVFGFFNPQLSAFGHSLVLPGSGFLGGWSFESVDFNFDLVLFFLSLAVFGGSVILWFATGNVILPPIVWALISISSSIWQSSKPNAQFESEISIIAFAIGPIFMGCMYAYRSIVLHRGKARRVRLNEQLSSGSVIVQPDVKDGHDELSVEALQHFRLLLDRALQPVDQFEGFEWIDQFQTAAVRYQINFISYAFSLAQANYMPDFTGYLSKAQQNLRAKQENYRIWKYWRAENLWGNLRNCADPIARDNIMYSGFVGAQLAYARQSGRREAKHLDGLQCRHGKADFSYSQDEIMQVLVSQYKNSDYGLLPCEPNWVYPLCNAITATAIRAHDAYEGSQYWESISDGFGQSLETEFMTPGGQLIPFRSNYTGFAPPQVGGAVMQAFPCLFLNSVLPDIAQRQWSALQIDMKSKNWRQKLWPADVGNYGFSRASSYAATALAAREMGDDQTADLLLEYLDSECPKVEINGIAHHSNASLWANANAFMAKTSRQNALRTLVTSNTQGVSQGPYLSEANPRDVLIAKAKNEAGVLTIIAYPTTSTGFKTFKISGLVPTAKYKCHENGQKVFTADQDGTQVINYPVNGRTEIMISQIS